MNESRAQPLQNGVGWSQVTSSSSVSHRTDRARLEAVDTVASVSLVVQILQSDLGGYSSRFGGWEGRRRYREMDGGRWPSHLTNIFGMRIHMGVCLSCEILIAISKPG